MFNKEPSIKTLYYAIVTSAFQIIDFTALLLKNIPSAYDHTVQHADILTSEYLLS